MQFFSYSKMFNKLFLLPIKIRGNYVLGGPFEGNMQIKPKETGI